MALLDEESDGAANEGHAVGGKLMKILVACEESQAVTIEMRNLGHEAYSCDLQEPSGGHPEWHIHGDALDALMGGANRNDGRHTT